MGHSFFPNDKNIARMSLTSGNQTVSSTNATTIDLDTSSLLVGDKFSIDVANKRINILQSGHFYINAQVRLGGVTDGEQMRVFINDSSTALAEGFNSGSSGTGCGVNVSSVNYLAAGNYVYLQIDSTADASYTVTAGAISTYLQIFEI